MNEQLNNMEDPRIPHHDVLQHENAFKVPAGYFDNLTEKLMQGIEKEAVPFAINEETFTVPQGYFESFPDKLINKIHQHQKPQIVRISFGKRLMLAAAVMIVLVVSWFSIKLYAPTNTDFLANSTEEELLEYVSYYAEEFDEQSLAMVMNEDEIISLDILEVSDEETSELLIELFE